MTLHRRDSISCALITFAVLYGLAGTSLANTVTGAVDVMTTSGQPLALKITIDDVKTRFELTGPSFSWYAWGFDTTTMQGYSLIVQGLDDTRSVVEQNLVGIGNPGTPQATQNLDFIDATHDVDADLTTVVLERLNSTGDASDPTFSPSMTSLAVIFAYDSGATPEFPNSELNFHGRNGRGFATITFVPEPGTAILIVLGTGLAAAMLRRRSRLRSG
jgi:hypothetical protein